MDLQAMARVWRDGQRKPCVVYRLLTTGCGPRACCGARHCRVCTTRISRHSRCTGADQPQRWPAGTLDEKMYQRQLKKGDLAAATMGGGGGGKAGGKFRRACCCGILTCVAFVFLPSTRYQPHVFVGYRPSQLVCSKDELKMLFTLRTDTACDTADLLRQAASGSPSEEEGDARAAAAAAAEFVDVSGGCADAPLRAAIAAGHVTFVHLDRAQQAAAAGAAAGAGGDAQQSEEGSGAASAGGVESLDVEDWGAAE